MVRFQCFCCVFYRIFFISAVVTIFLFSKLVSTKLSVECTRNVFGCIKYLNGFLDLNMYKWEWRDDRNYRNRKLIWRLLEMNGKWCVLLFIMSTLSCSCPFTCFLLHALTSLPLNLICVARVAPARSILCKVFPRLCVFICFLPIFFVSQLWAPSLLCFRWQLSIQNVVFEKLSPSSMRRICQIHYNLRCLRMMYMQGRFVRDRTSLFITLFIYEKPRIPADIVSERCWVLSLAWHTSRWFVIRYSTAECWWRRSCLLPSLLLFSIIV